MRDYIWTGGLPHLSKQVTKPTWCPQTPCKQALKLLPLRLCLCRRTMSRSSRQVKRAITGLGVSVAVFRPT